jgi:WD40 repeat protein
MNQPNSERESQEQKNVLKQNKIEGDVTFAPIQTKIYIETQIVEISTEKVTQKPLNKASPYKGLKKFNQSDRQYFFGRDALIAKLLNAVNKSSFSLILGASGSGKSSTVRAGLIPELKPYIKSPQKFYDFIFTPNQDPFESLHRCLLNEEKDHRFGESDVEFVREGKSNTLSQLIRLKKDEEQWLLFIDQFEQLFIDTDLENRKNFIEGIVRVAKKGDSSVRILLAMRSDFLEQFSFYSTLGAIANENNIHLVTEMYSDELRQAIEQPAAKHGVVFEPGLVEQIIKEVEGQSGYLPLLQYTLDLLWEKECRTKADDGRLHIEDRTLNKINYAALEGVRGALQKRVDEIYKNICAENQQGELVTKQIFLKLVNIVESDSGSRAVSRRGYRSEFIGDLVESILQRFIDENLLVSDYEYSSEEKLAVKNNSQPTQNATIEIAHEILLSSWEQLKRWVEEEKEAIILKNWLADETRRWLQVRAENEPKASDELLKGSRLEQILEFRQNHAFEKLGGLAQEENEFINASIERRDRLAREEEIRQQRELEQERKARKSAQKFVWTLIGGLVISLSLTGLATWQRHISTINEINALNNISETQLTSNQELDALLTSIKAGEKLKTENFFNYLFGIDTKTKINVLGRLQNIFYQVKEFNRLEDNDSTVRNGYEGSIFSPDGQTIASVSDDRTVKLWNLKGELLDTIEVDTSVDSLVFSPDGKAIVSGDENGKVQIWNLQGKLLHTLQGHTDKINNVIFSPNGKIIASASDDKIIKFWNRQGKLLHTLQGHQAGVNKLVFSPNGQTIASGSFDDTVRLWNLKGVLLQTLDGYTGYMKTLEFSLDGQTVISVDADKIVKLWNITRNHLSTFKLNTDYIDKLIFSPDGRVEDAIDEKKRKIQEEDNTPVLNGFSMKSLFKLEKQLDKSQEEVVLSPNRQTIASTNEKDKTIKLWNLKGELIHTLIGHTDSIKSVRFSPNGQTIASSSIDQTIKLWNLQGKLLSTFHGHNDHIWDVAFSPDGNILASSSRDRTVKLWKIKQKLLPTLEGHTSYVTSVAFSPDGQTLASASGDNTIKLWNTQGKLLHTLNGHTDGINSVVFSPDGQTLASASVDKTVKLWNLQGELLHTFQGHKGNIYNVAFSPDGQTFASVSYDQTIVKLWNLQGKLLYTFKGHSDTVEGIAFSPNGKILASASWDDTIKLWNLNTKGKLLRTIKGHQEGVKSVVFSPDGKILASASDDKTIKLWNLQGELLHTLNGHTRFVDSVAFSPDGKIVASASEDETIKLWNLQGELLHTLNGHTNGVMSVVFSPDGKTLASSSFDDTVKLWSLDLDNLDHLLTLSCNWVQDYLANNPNVSEQDRKLCQSQE